MLIGSFRLGSHGTAPQFTHAEIPTDRRPELATGTIFQRVTHELRKREFMSETATRLASHKHSALRAILRGGTLCGVLDITAAFVVYGGYFDVNPVLILQGIASGVLGSSAFQGGYPVALLGLLLHFFIAFTATFVYVLLSRWLSFLVQYVYVSGPLYGVVVYFFMQYIVIPLSAARKGPFSFKMMVIGVIIHILCVGLPISVTTRRYYL